MLDEAKVSEVRALMQDWTETPVQEDEMDQTFAEWLREHRPELASTLAEMMGREAPPPVRDSMPDEAKVEEVDSLMQEYAEDESIPGRTERTFRQWIEATRPDLAETLAEMTGRKGS